MRVCVACGSAHCNDAWVCADCGHHPGVLDGFRAFAPELATSAAGFHEEFFDGLAGLEAESFWFRARNELIAWALERYVPEARTFFEVGCGTGFVLSGIRARDRTLELVGSEIFSTGLAIAAGRVPSATFYQMDARAIPFREEFDAIGAFDEIGRAHV